MADIRLQLRKKDEELFDEVRKLKSGSQTDSNRIYELSQRYITKLIYDIVKDYHTTEDLTQETYMVIYNNIGSLRNPEAFYVWAGRIATNLTFRYIQRNKREILVGVDEEGDDGFAFDRVSDDREDMIPETVLMDREQQRIIADILDSLSIEQKLSVQYFYYEEMSVREIAETMGVSEGTVKSRLNYARKKIKDAVIDMDVKYGTRLYSLSALPILTIIVRGVAEGFIAVGAVGAGSAMAAGGTAAGTYAGGASAAGVAGQAAVSSGGSASGAAAGLASGGVAAAKGISVAGGVITGKIIAVAAAAIVSVACIAGAAGVSAGKHMEQAAEAERVRVAEEEARRIEEEQRRLEEEARQAVFDKYGEAMDVYESLTGATDGDVYEHFANLSADAGEIYGLINEMGEAYEQMKAGYKSCLTQDQYSAAYDTLLQTTDAIMGTQMLSAEELIRMNELYGDRAAMRTYMNDFKKAVMGMTSLAASGGRVLNDPIAKEVMSNFTADEVAEYLNQGITLPDMITMYINSFPSEEYNELGEAINSHVANSQSYMDVMNELVTFLTEDEEMQEIMAEYQEKYSEIDDDFYRRLQEALAPAENE